MLFLFLSAVNVAYARICSRVLGALALTVISLSACSTSSAQWLRSQNLESLVWLSALARFRSYAT